MVRLLVILSLLASQTGCTMFLVLRPDLATKADSFPGQMEGIFYPPEHVTLGPYDVQVTLNQGMPAYQMNIGPVSWVAGGDWQKDFQVSHQGAVASTMQCAGSERAVSLWGNDVRSWGAGKPTCLMTNQGVQWQGVIDLNQRGVVLTAPNGAVWVVETDVCGRGQQACGYYVTQNDVSIGGLDVLMASTPTLWLGRDVPQELKPTLVTALSLAYLISL